MIDLGLVDLGLVDLELVDLDLVMELDNLMDDPISIIDMLILK